MKDEERARKELLEKLEKELDLLTIKTVAAAAKMVDNLLPALEKAVEEEIMKLEQVSQTGRSGNPNPDDRVPVIGGVVAVLEATVDLLKKMLDWVRRRRSLK